MRRPFRPFPLFVLLFLSHALFYFFALGGDAVDDAYISFRYAQNALLGYGLVFNPGEKVEGFTNFLWTVLMLPFEGSGVDVGRASIVLGAALSLAILWLVLRFARLANLPRGAGGLAALLLAVDGTFALWSVGGLETALFAFLVFAGAVLYVREQEAETAPYSGVFFALAAMTRPEGLMVFGLTVAHQAAWRVLMERRLFTGRDIGRGGLFAALFVPYWLGRWSYYQSFFPNSFHAKVSIAGPEAQLERGWRHVTQFVGVHLGWVVLAPAAIVVAGALRQGLQLKPKDSTTQRESRKQKAEGSRQKAVGSRQSSLPSALCLVPSAFWSSYFAGLILVYAAYIVYVGGDWSVGRFFMPLLAPFYLLFAVGVVNLWTWGVERWGKLSTRRLEGAGLVAGVVVALLIFWSSSWNGEYGIYIRGFDAATATAAREAMGRWLRANVPRGTWIAVDAAGQVPYFSRLPAIDMFGINDLHIGRLPVATLGQGTPGHEKFDLGYVVGRAPQYVIIYGTLLDGVKEYERAPVSWTDNPELTKFLTLYVRRQ
jgi:arabinofuranosyltransferase